MPAPQHDPARVVAVVVTWNRRELLEESLDAVRAQSHAPVAVVVVDNASTDATADYLAGQVGLDVVHLEQNTGGAGGFAVGIEQSLTHRPDLIWLLDDDTVPTPTAAAELVRVWEEYGVSTPLDRRATSLDRRVTELDRRVTSLDRRVRGLDRRRRPSVLASKVVWTDGRDHPMNTPRAKPGARAVEVAAAERVGAVPVRSASFVSIMCDAEVVRERGLPVADYFLWNDDFEYSTRLIRGRVGLYVPASVVVHKTKAFGSTDVDPGERFFYEVRNKVWVFARSGGLAPGEKALYGASTLRRWARTVAHSQDRATLRRAAVRGLRAGLRRAPRSNAAVLKEAGWTGVGHRLAPGQPFALLMSTYAGDRADHLREAFLSSVVEQTRPPAQVVLVQDGPVGADLAAEIERLVAECPVPVTHLVLPENQGLGPALDAGLRASEHEVVARMDADDVSLPERFAKQLPLIEAGADIVGSGLIEFGADTGDVVGRRTPPVQPEEIRRVVRFRDPFNHPTVVYRRSAVRDAGGYAHLHLMEDYLLFTRMVTGGARPANLAEPLVYYRVGDGAYARRGGTALLRSELALQRRFRELGVTTRGQYVRNVAVRGLYRLVPQRVRKVAYRRLLANRSDGAGS